MGVLAAALLLAFIASKGSEPGLGKDLVEIRQTKSDARARDREMPASSREHSATSDSSNPLNHPDPAESPMADGIGHASSQDATDSAQPGQIPVAVSPAIVREQLHGMDDQDKGSFHVQRIEAAATSSSPPTLPMIYGIAPEKILAGNTHATPEVIDHLKDLFEEDAGVGTHPQDDPAAVEDWKAAEPTAADRMRTLFGWGAYGAFQREILEKKMREQGILGY